MHRQMTEKKATRTGNIEKQFLSFSGEYASHLPMLLLGLQISKGDVVELGSGEGSTMLLRNYCDLEKRKFTSYDNDEDWALKTGAIYIHDWVQNIEWAKPCGLLFIDSAPGEFRREMLIIMHMLAKVVVIHDSEENGLGNYNLDFSLFKYRLNYNLNGGGAGTTIVSNSIDVTKHEGEFYGYRFEK